MTIIAKTAKNCQMVPSRHTRAWENTQVLYLAGGRLGEDESSKKAEVRLNNYASQCTKSASRIQISAELCT